MTSDGPEQRGGPSETRTGSEATREESEEPERSGGSSEGASGERSDDENPESLLNIAGHEDRTPPGEEENPFGGDADGEPAESAQSDGSADPDEFYAGDEDDLDEVLAEDEEDAEADEAEQPAMDEVLPDDDAMVDGDEGAVEPVELLVQLAKRGDIDPWDIDIVRVTDEFLDALEDADLRTSGRALFYASVLLRMKGDELIHGSDDDEDEEELAPWEQPFADEAPQEPPDPDHDPVAGLEAEMERRLDRKQVRGTPETLDELVRDLREAERGSWWKRQREYDTSDSPRGFQRGTQTLDYHSGDDFRVDDEPTEDEVTGTTHEEDIEEIIDDVRAALHEHYDQGRAEVLYAEIDTVGGSRVQTFLALLFLAHRGQVRLQQDELFGDLWVQDPTAARGSEEAVAD
ncbi:segregation and condensation protein A [Haloarchaeobius amylolyticus]|uniref:segregation and condensation protein A n=1 Tax=Haloarchaeobius amylolyticus TaxID=1198296 RepID=UPI0022715BC4|nr:ScpA family protein [Haloarchaeobius amylolyticus]